FPSVLPFGVRTFLGPAFAGPRAPRPPTPFYPPSFRVAERESALRALDFAVPREHELPANEAFQASATHQREQLLVERPVEGPDLAHRPCRNPPITLPSTWTWSA